MSEDIMMNLGVETLKTAAMVASPMLLGVLLVGLIVSMFQAATQINEFTLVFISKILIVGVILLFAGSWAMDTVSVFTVELFENLDVYVRN